MSLTPKALALRHVVAQAIVDPEFEHYWIPGMEVDSRANPGGCCVLGLINLVLDIGYHGHAATGQQRYSLYNTALNDGYDDDVDPKMGTYRIQPHEIVDLNDEIQDPETGDYHEPRAILSIVSEFIRDHTAPLPE